MDDVNSFTGQGMCVLCFPSIFPITEPEDCARAVIEGARRDQEEVYVPKTIGSSFPLVVSVA